jgi:thiol-disulfide isomerase/thioredoxin
MARIVLALAAACGAATNAAAQTPDARTVVQAAVETMRAAQTVTYDAELTVRAGDSWRTVTGHVQLARFEADDASDPVGGRLAVRGEIRRSSSPKVEVFEAAYDGEWMRRVRLGAGVLLRGHPGFGGEELLRGSFGELIVREFLVPDLLTEQRQALHVDGSARTPVDVVACDVVEIRPRDMDRPVEWFFGVEDHLPRRMRRSFLSARGNQVESVLTLSNIKVNTEIDPGVFTLETPTGFAVETVGKRPPRHINIGDECPNWELTGSDGKTHRLSDYRGKLVLLDFWASTCPHCRRSMPAIQKLHDTYSGRGVALFALNCRDRGDIDPVAYVRDQGYSYFVADGNRAAIDYSVRGIPAFFVIDGEGRLLHRDTGYNEEKERQLIGIIERYLDEHGM